MRFQGAWTSQSSSRKLHPRSTFHQTVDLERAKSLGKDRIISYDWHI